MKKFGILQELAKCDTEIRSEQMLLGKMARIDLLNIGLSQTFSLFKKKKKNAVSVKCLYRILFIHQFMDIWIVSTF